MERRRLTASAAFLGYRIILDYDGSINNNQTNCNGKLKRFLAFHAPGFHRVRGIFPSALQQHFILLTHVQRDIRLPRGFFYL